MKILGGLGHAQSANSKNKKTIRRQRRKSVGISERKRLTGLKLLQDDLSGPARKKRGERVERKVRDAPRVSSRGGDWCL